MTTPSLIGPCFGDWDSEQLNEGVLYLREFVEIERNTVLFYSWMHDMAL